MGGFPRSPPAVRLEMAHWHPCCIKATFRQIKIRQCGWRPSLLVTSGLGSAGAHSFEPTNGRPLRSLWTVLPGGQALLAACPPFPGAEDCVLHGVIFGLLASRPLGPISDAARSPASSAGIGCRLGRRHDLCDGGISLQGSGGGAWPVVARGQQTAVPVVGFLSSASNAPPGPEPTPKGFRAG